MPEQLCIRVDHRFRGSPFRLNADLAVDARWNALFGPSGSGKTTLLRCVAGLLRPSVGKIALGDAVWCDTERHLWVTPERRNVGYLAQMPALFPHLNVAQNVAFGQRYVQSSVNVEELMQLFRCGHLALRAPANLSGGEQQRVALARALATDPVVLILDEPFRGLDSELRDSIVQDLQSYLAARPIPVLMVSHDPVEALSLGAHVFRMAQGAVVEAGPCGSVLQPELSRLIGQLERYSATTGS